MECQHSRHADYHSTEEATLWVLAVCPRCGKRKQYAICKSGFRELTVMPSVRCAHCKHVHSSSESLTVVRPVD